MMDQCQTRLKWEGKISLMQCYILHMELAFNIRGNLFVLFRCSLCCRGSLLPTTTLTEITVVPYNMTVTSATVMYGRSWHQFNNQWCVAYEIVVTTFGDMTAKSASTKMDNILTDHKNQTLSLHHLSYQTEHIDAN